MLHTERMKGVDIRTVRGSDLGQEGGSELGRGVGNRHTTFLSQMFRLEENFLIKDKLNLRIIKEKEFYIEQTILVGD